MAQVLVSHLLWLFSFLPVVDQTSMAGDFQYKDTRISAKEIFENVKDVIPINSTLYIATDEKLRSFFDIFAEHYRVYYLDSNPPLVKGLNPNYYGMLEQLITSRAKVFVGTYYSTFTGYINRLRGYHSQKDRAPGYEKGEIESYYYVPIGLKHSMKKYNSVQPPFWAREFPVGKCCHALFGFTSEHSISIIWMMLIKTVVDYICIASQFYLLVPL